MVQALSFHEQQYRTLVENLPDYVVRYDTALRRIYVNPAWEAASGLSSEEVVDVSTDAIPKVPKPVSDEYQSVLHQALVTGECQEVEFSWTNAHNVKLYLQYVVVPECGKDGKVNSLLSVGRDITKLKLAEEVLTAARIASVHRVNRALSTLSAGNQALVRADRRTGTVGRDVPGHGGKPVATPWPGLVAWAQMGIP